MTPRAVAARALAEEVDVAKFRGVLAVVILPTLNEEKGLARTLGDLPLDRLAIGVAYQDPSNVARWAKGVGGLRCRGNTWFLPYPTIQRRAQDRPHPASFPPELPEWCLKLHGVGKVRLAVDPFVGIGPSALAALRLGLPFIGFDIEAEYLGEARRALEAAGAVPVAE